jgi:predicted alpha/beta superfamily hydrolase
MKCRIEYLIILLFLFINSSCKQEGFQPDLSFEVKNQATGYEYLIDIVYFNGKSSSNVLFVLEPSSMLPLVQESLKDINYSSNITLVCIDFRGDNKRNRDYTPTKNGDETGEAESFFNFISSQLDTELQIRGVINSTSEKGIIGHSISGLASVYAFLTQNDYFHYFAIGSPSLWWDSYSIFAIEKDFRNVNSNASSKIFMGVGYQEDLGMQNAFEALTDILDENYPGINLKTHLSKGGHMSSRSETINEGLKYLLQ